MVNLKKIVLASLALGLVNVATAAMYMPPATTVEQTPEAKNGFYAGIGLGAIGVLNNISGNGSNSSATGIIETSGSGSDDNGSVGLDSTVFVGYSWALPHQFVLGVEAFGNYTNTAMTIDNVVNNTVNGVTLDSDSVSQFKFDSVYGIRALPGYQFTSDYKAYAILGYARSHGKLSNLGGTAQVGENVLTFPSNENSYDFNGYQVGLGSMYKVTEHVAIRGDIIYSGYGSETTTSTTSEPNGSSSSSSLTVKPSTVEGNVSLVYMFD